MAKGILGGVGVGVLASAIGLGALSLMAPPPNASAGVKPAGPATAVIPVPEASEFGKGPSDPAVAAPMAEIAPSATGPVPATAPSVENQPALATDPALRPTASEAPTAPDAPQTATAALDVPIEGESPIPVPPPGEAQAPGLGRPVSEGVVADPDTAPRTAALPEGPVEAAQPMGSKPAEAAPEDNNTDNEADNEVDGDPTEKTPEADMTDGKPEVIIIDAPSAPAGQPTGFSAAPTGFQNAGNVTTNRLPAIGKAPADAADNGETPGAKVRPIEAFALPFAALEDAPLYSVVLVDPGTKAGALDTATIKTIGFPVTIAIDPNRPDATTDAQAYRDAGFEVAILANALPEGATPQDLEIAVEAWRQAIPEAVAVVEPAKPVLQTNRILSQTLIKILAREGLGLVTQSGGLNAAEQLAAKEGVPHAQVWRVIDDGREKAPVIERMLGRAGFEATKGGAVAVMISAWPESISGLLTWEPGHDKALVLAPISAMALRGK